MKLLKLSKKKYFFLSFILALGLFFRLYKANLLFGMGHEQDLQAWIVKDILVDKHFRLIGQETSVHGVFIGPLYYYLLIPLFWIFSLDPRASIIPITAISVATILSVYFVFKNIFSEKVGVIATFIYALSYSISFIDRWPVPTQTTFLWVIWYIYVLFSFLKRDLRTLPILVILIGLVWHIHIAFIPLLFLLPITLLISKPDLKSTYQRVNKRYLILSLVGLGILLAPFAAFELRHGFQQVKSITRVYEEEEKGAIEGKYRMEVILENADRVFNSPFYEYRSKKIIVSNLKIPILMFGFLGLVLYLYKAKALTGNQTLLIYFWIVDVIFSHFFSKRLISEYYFNNLMLISVVIVSVFLAYLSRKKLGFFVASLLILFAVVNLKRLISTPVPKDQFSDKSNVVSFISTDMHKNSYPCVSINYIGGLGVEYGYRFLFWKNGVKQVTPENDIPVYSIVNPFSISEREIAMRSGDLGVILPAKSDFNFENCGSHDRQLLPLNGFTN